MLLYDSEEYRSSKNWPYAVGAGCIVFRLVAEKAPEVLLLSRDYDHDSYSAGDTGRPSYHLPKGHVGFDETLIEAALRETKEEIGAIAQIVGYLGTLQHDFNHPRLKELTDKTIHYFAARWLENADKTDNEHDGREWVSLSEAEKLLGSPNPKGEDEIVRRLVKFLELTS